MGLQTTNATMWQFAEVEDKVKETGVEGLKQMKRGRKTKCYPKGERLERELATLKSAFVDQSVELQLLKKRELD